MVNSSYQREFDALSISVIKDFDQVATEYDEQDSGLDGHRFGKKFYRIDSSCFPKLLTGLRENEDCGYITYANGVIRDGMIPEKLSCLFKPLRFEAYSSEESVAEELVVNEVLASQILNYFGCPTVYNTATIRRNENGVAEYGLVSVDFSTDDEEFKTLRELKQTVPEWIINRNDWKKWQDNSGEYPQEYLDDFIYSFLVRHIILHDGDYNDNNLANLIDNENGEKRLLNFDFEYAFDDIMFAGVSEFMKCLMTTLTELRKHNPGLYKRFIDNCTNLQRAIDNIPPSKLQPINEYHKEIVYDRLKMNLNLVQEAVRRIENVM